jgi:hypothetical protein
MPRTFGEGTVLVDGVGGVEEAMPLLEFLLTHGAAHIDMRANSHPHSAALQVLIAASERVTDLPEEELLRRWWRGSAVTHSFDCLPAVNLSRAGSHDDFDNPEMRLTRQLGDRVAGFKEMFEQALADCVMASQRDDHRAASGESAREDQGLSVELF